MNIIHHRSDGMGYREYYGVPDTPIITDIIQCPHCHIAFEVHVNDEIYFCPKHNACICKNCAGKPCIDYMKLLDAYEKGKVTTLNPYEALLL